MHFQVGQHEERSLVKAFNQINSNLDRIPPGAGQPLVQSLSRYDVPILTLTLGTDEIGVDDLRGVAAHFLSNFATRAGSVF